MSSVAKIHVNSGERADNFTSAPVEPGPPPGPDSPVAP